ncbi:MAG: sugar transferase [Acidobacteriota bacterium]|jgi:exopolysaccharide biosynthesis polyprenyl glycosylphosphotransferase
MIKEQTRLLATATVLFDVLALILSFEAAYVIRDRVLTAVAPDRFPAGLFQPERYLWMFAVILPAWVTLFFAFRLYSSARLMTFRRLLADLVQANAIGLGIVLAAAYLLKEQDISRSFLVLFGIVNLVFIAGSRLFLRAMLRRYRSGGLVRRHVVIVGTGPEAQEYADLVEQNRAWGLSLIGLIRERADDTAGPGRIGGRPVLGHVRDLERIFSEHVVDEVIFVVPGRMLGEFEESFLLCEDLGINARIAVGMFPHLIAKAQLEEFQGRPLLTFTTTSTNTFALALKRLFDLTVGLLLFAVLLIPGLLIALAIKLDSRGPVLFAQVRSGLHGRRFRMYKFRSMVQDAEARRAELEARNEMDGPVFKMRRDPRVTRVGRLLRRTSLDELPQILNIILGDMSLVGPRPPIPAEVNRYRRWQRRRLSMKPGVTCLWQVSGRNQVDFEEWMRLDLRYIDSWSLWLDLKILMRTIPAVLTGRGAS